MKVSILIISYIKHFPWLKQCLRSIEKYATGFHEVSVWVPNEDIPEMQKLEQEYKGSIPIRVVGYDDWPAKGMLKHFDLIFHADQCCPEADYITHMDSDTIFIAPVTPADYIVDGKPVLMYASYDWLGRIEPAILCWQEGAHQALGWKPHEEAMRRLPLTYTRETYLLTRQCVERNVRKPISDYIKDQRNEFPQTVNEFPTLGAYAWRFMSQRYQWINQELEPRPKDKLFQLWGHASDFNAPMEVWHNDQKVTVIPNEIFAKYL